MMLALVTGGFMQQSGKRVYVKRCIDNWYERSWAGSSAKQDRRKRTNRKFRHNKLSTDYVGGEIIT